MIILPGFGAKEISHVLYAKDNEITENIAGFATNIPDAGTRPIKNLYVVRPTSDRIIMPPQEGCKVLPNDFVVRVLIGTHYSFEHHPNVEIVIRHFRVSDADTEIGLWDERWVTPSLIGAEWGRVFNIGPNPDFLPSSGGFGGNTFSLLGSPWERNVLVSGPSVPVECVHFRSYAIPIEHVQGSFSPSPAHTLLERSWTIIGRDITMWDGLSIPYTGTAGYTIETAPIGMFGLSMTFSGRAINIDKWPTWVWPNPSIALNGDSAIMPLPIQRE
jgi:hypothetical protein